MGMYWLKCKLLLETTIFEKTSGKIIGKYVELTEMRKKLQIFIVKCYKKLPRLLCKSH